MIDITKRFGEVTVFDKISLDLKAGEVLSIVGENGAGKSTLMNVLSGAHPHGTYDGRIMVDGIEKAFAGPQESQRAGIEMIHQEISLHLDLSVAENVLMGNLPRRFGGLVDWRLAIDLARQCLSEVGLDVPPREELRNLSTSQQQLVSIARALARKPRILVLDEPTSALTISETENLLGIIRRLAASGISCIYISHHMEEVFRISDRIQVLRDGKVISVYSKPEFDENRIIEDMVGRKIEAMYPKETVPLGPEILRVENLTVPHPFMPLKNIVEGIGFRVRRGEILCIAGLVGAGRSESVNAIFGTQKRLSGEIYLDGAPVKVRSSLDAIAAGIGLVPEERKKSGLIAAMSIKENMTIASLRAISWKEVIRKKKERNLARRFFERLKIKAQGIDANILSVSGGNQQKVVLAKWLMKDLKVLFLDEPTRGVDVGAKVEIYHIIAELVKSGVGIVMVSSDLPELLGLGDRFIALADGRIRAEIERRDVSPERIMRAVTGIRETMENEREE
jgi:ABC-type sugar transport system ATPase subunit